MGAATDAGRLPADRRRQRVDRRLREACPRARRNGRQRAPRRFRGCMLGRADRGHIGGGLLHGLRRLAGPGRPSAGRRAGRRRRGRPGAREPERSPRRLAAALPAGQPAASPWSCAGAPDPAFTTWDRCAPPAAPGCWSWGWSIAASGGRWRWFCAASENGWRIVEVPVPYAPRRAGQSKVTGTLTGTLRTVRDMGALLK